LPISPGASAWEVVTYNDYTYGLAPWEREMTQSLYCARRYYGQLPGRTDISIVSLYVYHDATSDQVREAAYADWQAGTLQLWAGTSDPVWIKNHCDLCNADDPNRKHS